MEEGSGEGWQKRVYNKGDWKKLLRMARNRYILHVAMEWINEYVRKIWCRIISVIGHCSTILMFYIFTLICHQQVAIVLVYLFYHDGGFGLVDMLCLIVCYSLLFHVLWYYCVDFKLIVHIPHIVFMYSLSLWHMLWYGMYVVYLHII
jgi:hypothetical protein